MTTKEAIQKIKGLFEVEIPTVPAVVEPVEAMATEYTLADGVTVVSIDKLEVGGMVTVEGNPAPDAKHELADGTCVTTVSGVITEVEVKEAEPTEPEMSAVTPAMMTEMKADFAKQTADQDTLIATLSKDLANQKEITKELFALVETLGTQEVAAPIEAPAKDWTQMTALEKRRATK